jgi:hypothetical protein
MAAPLAAWILYGRRPDSAPAQTPRLGGAAVVAVTKEELALVSLRRGTPAGVIARVPLAEVTAFDLRRSRGVWPLTITFSNADSWRLEVLRFNKRAASNIAVAVAVGGQGQPSHPGLGTASVQRPQGVARSPILLSVMGAVVVAGVVIGALSFRGHAAAAPGRSPAASHAARPAAARQRAPARIGSSFNVQDGNGDTYRVTLVKIIDPAHGAGQFNAPDRGTRLVAAVFRITAVKGSPNSEDADNDAALVGSNGRTYVFSFDDIVGYTNFSNGVIHVPQGGSTVGAVSFEVPDGVQVTDIKWTAASGFGSTVRWADGS